MAKKTKLRRREPGEALRRVAVIRAEDVSAEKREITVSFSSQTDKVTRWGVPEILLHEKGAADFDSLREVGSVLLNHDVDQVIGRPEDIELDEKARKGRARIVFDADPESQRVFDKVRAGSIKGVSVGGYVDTWLSLEDGVEWMSPRGQKFVGPAFIGTKWRAAEFSLTPTPADPAVGVNRSRKEDRGDPEEQEPDMDKKLRAKLEAMGLPTTASDDDALAFLDNVQTERGGQPKAAEETKPKADGDKPEDKRDVGRIAEEAVARERERVVEIRRICGFHESTSDLAENLIKDGISIEKARAAVIDKLAADRPNLSSPRRVEVGTEQRDKFAEAAVDHILMRAGTLRDKDATRLEKRLAGARDVEASSLLELARECLRQGGLSTKGFSRDEVLVRAFSHSTSDYPKILENAAFKAMMLGWEEAPATWRPLVRVTSAVDFKTMKRARLGDAGDLVETPELTEPHEGSVPEHGDSYAIATYSKRFGISRQALVNDDMDAFSAIPTLMGAAARRLPSKLFYDLLISAAGVGPTMVEDGLPLFSTTHTSGANYIAAAGAPDVAGLGALMKLLRTQKGHAAAGETAPVLNIMPEILLVPAALETVALQFINSTSDPAKSNSNTNNPFNRRFSVIVEPRLDGGTNGGTAFYLVANPNSVAGAEVAFLNGQETPSTHRDESNPMMGLQWTIWSDVGVKFIGHRGWARTRGA